MINKKLTKGWRRRANDAKPDDADKANADDANEADKSIVKTNKSTIGRDQQADEAVINNNQLGRADKIVTPKIAAEGQIAAKEGQIMVEGQDAAEGQVAAECQGAIDET